MPMPKDPIDLPNLRDPKYRSPEPSKKHNLTRAGRGRPRGAISRISRDLREGLVESAIIHGRDGRGRDGLVGFLVHLAVNHPRTHGGLLAKLLPLQVAGDVHHTTVGEVRIISIPSDRFLSQEDANRLSKPGLQLEHDPQPVDGTLERAGDVEIDPPSQASPSEPRDPGAYAGGAEGQQPNEAEQIADLKRQINELARHAGLDVVV